MKDEERVWAGVSLAPQCMDWIDAGHLPRGYARDTCLPTARNCCTVLAIQV